MSQVTIQVLCVEAIDSITGLVIITNNHRILIDCGEGTQRLCIEHKIKLSKISAILFTDISPQRILGFPGYALLTLMIMMMFIIILMIVLQTTDRATIDSI
jgi:ribonuclease Z